MKKTFLLACALFVLAIPAQAREVWSKADAAAYLTGKIRAGGSGVWGAIPMPAQGLPGADANAIAQWLADGAKK